jgi:hypothetical protein
MIRNLKVMGVALAAVFALSAVVASAALAAAGVLTSDGPVTLKTSETGSTGANSLTAFGGHTSCAGTVLTGHKLRTTPHAFIESGANSVTITPDFGNLCTTTLNGTLFSSTFDVNSCDLELVLGETIVFEAQEYSVTAGVKCDNPGDHINVTLFSSSAHSLKLCTYTIDAAESGIAGGRVRNTAGSPDDLDLTGTFEKFTVTRGGLCGSAKDEEAKLDIDATVKGYNEAGQETGITVSHS